MLTNDDVEEDSLKFEGTKNGPKLFVTFSVSICTNKMIENG